MPRYNKPHLSFEHQLELLKSRGLEVTNDNTALEYLRRLGYYRLSGYWYPCRKLLSSAERQSKLERPQRSDEFMPDARFQDTVALYVFDKKLRLLIRVYVVLCILAHFMKIICPRSTWQIRLVELMRSFPKSDYISIQDMGFPTEWEQQIFWKN